MRRISRKGGWKIASMKGKMQIMQKKGLVGGRWKGGVEGDYDER